MQIELNGLDFENKNHTFHVDTDLITMIQSLMTLLNMIGNF